MAIETRTPDNVSKVNTFIGMPFIEFARETSPGVFDPFRQLGIPDSAALQKTIETITLDDARSGVTVVDLEIVSRLEPRINIVLFNFEPENMRLFMASDQLVTVGAGVTPVTDDEFSIPSTPSEFADLTNFDIATEPLTDLDVKPIVGEAVGTGDGVGNSFSLDFPVLAVADANVGAGIVVGGVSYTAIAVGAEAGGNEVTVEIGDLDANPASGDLEFFVGGSTTPPILGDAIVADYTPSFAFVNLVDYALDIVNGRIRMLPAGAGNGLDKVRSNEFLIADYSYNALDRNQLRPLTQNEFKGKARIKQLTDTGINFIWDIPSVQIRITDDDFAWSKDAFASATLIMTILNVGGVQPFGFMETFPQTP